MNTLNKKIFAVLLATLCLSFATALAVPVQPQCAVKFTFINNMDKKIIYELKWVDHNFKHPLPYSMALGGLAPGQRMSLKNAYPCGIYMVVWQYEGKTYRYAFSQNEGGEKILESSIILEF